MATDVEVIRVDVLDYAGEVGSWNTNNLDNSCLLFQRSFHELVLRVQHRLKVGTSCLQNKAVSFD